MADEQAPGGAVLMQKLTDAGVSSTDIFNWRNETKNKMIASGVPLREADAYFGIQTDPPKMPYINDYVKAEFDMLDPAKKPQVAQGGYEAVMAGFGMSASVLPFKDPSMVMPENPGFREKLGFAVGQTLGDAPVAAAAGVAGFSLGGPIGAGAAGAGVPELFRQLAYDSYNHPGGAATWTEVASRLGTVAAETGIATASGGVGGKVGAVAGGAALKEGGVLGATVAGGLAAGGAAMATQAALNMHLPDKEDFAIGALLLLGGMAGHQVKTYAGQKVLLTPAGQFAAQKMMELWRDTGMHPNDLARAAHDHPEIASEILGPYNAQGKRITPALDELRPNDPPPFAEYKPTALPPEKVIAGNPKLDNIVDLVASLETGHIKDEATRAMVRSPAGAIGYNQIMPDTARQYGFDPARLTDKAYNQQVSRTILTDLNNRFPDDLEAILIGYNAGPKRAQRFINSGRDYSTLPAETRVYLANAARKGALDGPIAHQIDEQLQAWKLAPDGPTEPMTRKNQASDIKWQMEGPYSDAWVVRKTSDGREVADPNMVASYLQKFGQLADFRFIVGDPNVKVPEDKTAFHAAGGQGPKMEFLPDAVTPGGKNYDITGGKNLAQVWMPSTPDDLARRWWGLGRYEVLHHEVGHALDLKFNGGNNIHRYLPPGKLRDEMMEASKEFRPYLWEQQPDYNSTPAELFADAFASWISNPTRRKLMPEFTKIWGERLKPYLKFADQAMPMRVEKLDAKGEPTGETEWKLPVPVDSAVGAGGGKGGGGKPPAVGGDDVFSPGKGPRKIEDNSPKLSPADYAAKIAEMQAAPGVRFGSRPEWLKPRTWFPKLDAWMVEHVLSRYASARRLDDKLGIGNDIEFFNTEDMARQTLASRNTATYTMTRGTIDAMTRAKTSDDSYHKAFTQVAEDGGNMEGFVAYRVAKRVIEKTRQGIEIDPRLNLRDASNYVRETTKLYERAHQTIQRVKRANVQYGEDSGLWTPERARAMNDLNQDHVTVRRVMEGPSFNPPNPGRELGVVPAPQRMKGGSERQIVDINTADWDNNQTIIRLADRNRALVHIVRALEDAQNKMPLQIGDKRKEPFYTVRDASNERWIRNGVGEIQDENGNVIRMPKDSPFTPLIALRNQYNHLGPDEFLFFDRGVPKIARVHDADAARLIRSLTYDDPDVVVGIATKLARLQRAGISLDPSFPIRSWSIGQITKVVQAEGVNRIPFRHMGQAIMEVWNKGPIWDEWVRNGGMGSALIDMDKRYAQYQMEDFFNAANDRNQLFEARQDKSGVWNVLDTPMQIIQTVLSSPIKAAQRGSHFLDSAARVADFIGAQRKGASPMKAAMLSRTSQLDYAEPFGAPGATVMNMFARSTAFFATGIKDLEQTFQSLAKRPGTYAAMGVSVFVMPTIVNYAANLVADIGKADDDPTRYTNLPQWQRDMYWVTPEMGGNRYKLPRGIGPTSAMFATTTERFLDYWFKADPKGIMDWAQTVVKQSGSPFVPALVAPGVDIALNKTGTGQPLIPASQEQASGSMKYGPNTTETAKALSRFLAGPETGIGSYWRGSGLEVPPAYIDNLVREWTGSLPIKIISTIERYADVKAVKPPTTLADNPLVGWFFVRNPVGGQRIEDYYTMRKEFKEQAVDKSLATKRMEMGELSSVDMLKASASSSLTNIDKALAAQRTALENIYSSSMTDGEKRRMTDLISQQMMQIASGGLKLMHSIKNQGPTRVPMGTGRIDIAPKKGDIPAAPGAPQ